MAKTYKLWIEIEEYDDEAEERYYLSRYGEAKPVQLGEFTDLDKAVEVAESLEWTA